MLKMVIENPMQLTIVKAVPLIFTLAFWATSVEKRGESAMTTNPQKIKKAMNSTSLGFVKKKGDCSLTKE